MLKTILEQYRNGERGMPTYDELAAIAGGDHDGHARINGGACRAQAEPGADERAAFEKWMRSNRYDVGVFASGEYHNMFARNAWMGWQARAAQSSQRAAVAECQWTHDFCGESGLWDSACGEAWGFIDGGPQENGVKFCHGCGGRIVIAAAPTPAVQEGGK